jgi:hypothetical protein
LTQSFSSRNFETRLGGGLTLGSDDGFHVSIGGTAYGGSYQQQTGFIGFGGKDWSLTYENDFVAPYHPFGDGGDRFRTAALRVTVQEFSAGFNLFTGDPGVDERKFGHNLGKEYKGKYEGTYEEKTPQYRLGALYVGYKNFNIGTNSENVREFIQNRCAHGNGCWFPVFEKLNSNWRFYGNYQTKNPYSLW